MLDKDKKLKLVDALENEVENAFTGLVAKTDEMTDEEAEFLTYLTDELHALLTLKRKMVRRGTI